jgi:hypothetical protein
MWSPTTTREGFDPGWGLRGNLDRSPGLGDYRGCQFAPLQSTPGEKIAMPSTKAPTTGREAKSSSRPAQLTIHVAKETLDGLAAWARAEGRSISAQARVWSKNRTGRHGITPPLDGNSAEARPIARGTAQALRAADPSPQETARRCPSPGDSARHGNGRHNCTAPAVTTARRTG